MKKTILTILVLTFLPLLNGCDWFNKSSSEAPLLDPVTIEMEISTKSIKEFGSGGIKIPGVSEVATIFKSGSEIVSGVKDIVSNVFGNSKRINNGFTETRQALNEIKVKIDGLLNGNEQIIKRLETMEATILAAIDIATRLESRYVDLDNKISGSETQAPEIESFRGPLVNLSREEFRPTKVAKLIMYYEYYIASYGILINNNPRKKEFLSRIKIIDEVLRMSNELERNLIQFNEIHETKIDLLTEQLIYNYKIAKAFQSNWVRNDYKTNEFYRIEKPSDLDLNESNIPNRTKPDHFQKQLLDKHISTRDEIINLVYTRNLYLESTKAIKDYRDKLADEQKTLINKYSSL